MKRVLLAMLSMVVVFPSVGCKCWEKLKCANQSSVDLVTPGLSSEEKFFLENWLYAAKMAEDVQDYSTAVIYYKKIYEYFPDTKEGDRAQKRLKKLEGNKEKNKVSLGS